MLDIRGAVKAVVEHVDSWGDLVPTGAIRLEEFDYDADNGIWRLTFSFDDPFGAQRIYRTFEVDGDGGVVSMKIREPASPF